MKRAYRRLGVIALTGMLASAQALAQSSKPPPQGAPSGPIKVDLLPYQANWIKVCFKEPGSGREACYTTRDFGQGPDQPPLIALAIYDVKGEDQRVLRVMLPVGLLLKPGFKFAVDQGKSGSGSFAMCMPNGCFAESDVSGSTISAMRHATTLSVSVRNQVNNEVMFTLPLAGFGKAFDGAPVDPKVLQAQQEAYRHQLEERAKQERERIEQQQKAGAAAPAPKPAPAK